MQEMHIMGHVYVTDFSKPKYMLSQWNLSNILQQLSVGFKQSMVWKYNFVFTVYYVVPIVSYIRVCTYCNVFRVTGDTVRIGNWFY
jgi:hypothetical protein